MKKKEREVSKTFKQNEHTMSKRYHSEPTIRTFQPDRKINDVKLDDEVDKEYKT